MWRARTHPRCVGHSAVFLFFIFIFFYFSAGQNTSVHEILPKYGLPAGLLPDSVNKYNLGEDGSFSVELDKPCYVEFDYLVYYDRVITGKLSYGSITELTGIQVKRLFLWLGVDEIKVDLPPSDYIYFQVGFICKRLDVAQFQSLHSCRRESASCRMYHRDPLLQLATAADDNMMLLTE